MPVEAETVTCCVFRKVALVRPPRVTGAPVPKWLPHATVRMLLAREMLEIDGEDARVSRE